MIFTVTHKKLETYPQNTIVVGTEEIDNLPPTAIRTRYFYPNIAALNPFYGETEAFRFIADHCNDDYLGQMTYRRRFDLPDDIGDYDGAAARMRLSNTVQQQYGCCHLITDLTTATEIIADLHPGFVQTWLNTLNGTTLRPYGCFVLRADYYKEFTDMLFDIYRHLLQRFGITDLETLRAHIAMQTNNDVEYQMRLGGFIAERLFTAYASKLKIKELDITMNEP